jgi:cytoskeletal protein RodZ
MSCSQCGAQTYLDSQRFCGNCGAQLIGAERPTSDASADPAAAAAPQWPSPAPAKAPREIKKPLLIAAVVVLIVVLAGAGVFFALLRSSGKEEVARLEQPVDQPAEPKSSSDSPPPPQEEAPGPKTQAAPKNSPPARARPSAPAASTRRTGVAGTYEAVRDTSVYESPAASSRVVASIPRGFKVTVVGSTGNWLEVRSTSGRPPGFIRRSDALPRERLS